MERSASIVLKFGLPNACILTSRHSSRKHSAMKTIIARCSVLPCLSAMRGRIMALWGNGGLVLGFLTALLGRQGIWICTAAVEAAVHRHLQDQLLFVRDRDPELHGLILAIQKEELMHLHYAEERLLEGKFLSPILGTLISGATDFAIWLETWGDSSQMAKELAAAKQAR